MAGRAGDVIVKILPNIQFILNISILIRLNINGGIVTTEIAYTLPHLSHFLIPLVFLHYPG
jgi:hypothetical protein